MEQNWREYNKQDNYESSSVDPCQTCKHYRYVKPDSNSGGGGIWALLFVVALVGCFILFMHWQDDEEKLKNCVYYDSSTHSIHYISNGSEDTLLNSDDINYLDDLLDNDLSSDDW